jgi:hypothetical protein
MSSAFVRPPLTAFAQLTADISTNSDSAFVGTGVTVTLEGPGALEVRAVGAVADSSGGQRAQFRIDVDGTSQSQTVEKQLTGSGGSPKQEFALGHRVVVGAGIHTVTVQWKSPLGGVIVMSRASSIQYYLHLSATLTPT